MKILSKIAIISCLAIVLGLSACDGDDNGASEIVEAIIGADITTDIESTVTLDASGSSSSLNATLTYEWLVTDPDGIEVTLENGSTASPSFLVTKSGNYGVGLTVSSDLVEDMTEGTVTVVSPMYAVADQMGRPAINTVFNFFGTGEVKNAYNQTLPSAGSANADDFKGILDALQTYIFLDPAQFENILGIGNEALAGTLAVDVLTSNKNSASAYGSLNGRALADDVVDVTLLLAFSDQSAAGAGNMVKDGVSSDHVDANDKSFGTTFPYLATPH